MKKEFTAEQAAQKRRKSSRSKSSTFTAEQAAQKIRLQSVKHTTVFTAEQAAQKPTRNAAP